jgi:hypothetical protein
MMSETKIYETGAIPSVESIESDWFPLGICLDGANFNMSARELFRATLIMRQQMVGDLPDESEISTY